MAITIIKQPGLDTLDPFVGVYSNDVIVATSTNAFTTNFKYVVSVNVYYNVYTFNTSGIRVSTPTSKTITVKQPSAPNTGFLTFNPNEILKSFVDETWPIWSRDQNSVDYTHVYSQLPFINNILENMGVKYNVSIIEELNGVIQAASQVNTLVKVGYYGTTSNSQEYYNDIDKLTWTNSGTNTCPVPLADDINNGLLTVQPNVIMSADDSTAPFSANRFVTVVDMPRHKYAQVPMYMQRWSNSDDSKNMQKAFSVIHHYFNGTTPVATKAYVIDTCGDSQVSSATFLNNSYDVTNSFASLGYEYHSPMAASDIEGIENASTHIWVTTHVYSDPDVCRGTSGTPALDCNSMTSIIAYSEPHPISAYRINLYDICENEYMINGTDRSKFGQIVFQNSYGGWDTIFLKQVKEKYSIKKTTWRGKNQEIATTVWPTATADIVYSTGLETRADKSVRVSSTDNTRQFTLTTDYLLDNTEEMIRQLFSSPAAYLITNTSNDSLANYWPGNLNYTDTFRILIDSSTYDVKRRQTDRLFQYKIDVTADIKPRTQRT